MASEQQKLEVLVDQFAIEMKRKLNEKRKEGWRGWNKLENEAAIRKAMLIHAVRGEGQEVDVANLCAMLWNFQRCRKP